MKTSNTFPFTTVLLSLVASALFVSCTKEKELNKPDTSQQAVQFAATLPSLSGICNAARNTEQFVIVSGMFRAEIVFPLNGRES